MGSLAESLIAFCESHQSNPADAVHMPEGIRIVHPFFAAIFTDRAVKEFVDTGIGIIQERNQVCFSGTFCFIKKPN